MSPPATFANWVYQMAKADAEKLDMMNEKYVHIMQYSGKIDQNGVEIYEGDIVKTDIVYEVGTIEMVGVMEFDKPRSQFGVVAYHNLESLPGQITSRKPPLVIGNIYEHPHLIPKPHEKKS